RLNRCGLRRTRPSSWACRLRPSIGGGISGADRRRSGSVATFDTTLLLCVGGSRKLRRSAMATIEPRTRTNSRGVQVTRYLVRYRTPDGKDRAPGFDRLRDARAFKANIEADLVRGEYIDPDAG